MFVWFVAMIMLLIGKEVIGPEDVIVFLDEVVRYVLLPSVLTTKVSGAIVATIVVELCDAIEELEVTGAGAIVVGEVEEVRAGAFLPAPSAPKSINLSSVAAARLPLKVVALSVVVHCEELVILKTVGSCVVVRGDCKVVLNVVDESEEVSVTGSEVT